MTPRQPAPKPDPHIEPAVCEGCLQPMRNGGACTLRRYDFPTGSGLNWHDRIPFGSERRDKILAQCSSLLRDLMAQTKDRNCSDCAVRPGAFHHVGCDKEECPSCGQQALGCDCITHGPKTAAEREAFFTEFARMTKGQEKRGTE